MAQLNTSLDKMPAASRRLYDELKQKRGTIDGMYLTLLNHPELAQHVSQLGTYLRFGSTLPADVRETMILITAHAERAEYEWIKHVPCARSAGVPDETIAAIGSGHSLAPQNRAYALIEEVHECVVSRRSIPHATQDEILAKWGSNGILELVVLVGFYRMINGIITAFDVPLPADTP